MFALKPVALLALAAVANAMNVTSPDQSTAWSSSSSSQTISYNPVSSDPTSFTVQLVNQAGFLSNSPVTLIANQSTGTANVDNTITVTYPGGTWPTGTAFQINLVAKDSASAAIYAQSAQFNITNSGSVVGGSAGSASAVTGMSPTTISMASVASASSRTAANAVTVVSATTGSGDASGGIPNSAATSKSAGEIVGAPSALISVMIGVAGFFGLMA